MVQRYEGVVWDVPESLDSPEVRRELDEFAAMRRRIGKPIKSLKNTSRVLKGFDDQEHLLYALNHVIGNEYQGLKPDYRPEPKAKPAESAKDMAARTLAILEAEDDA